jgi:hypothetical protein
MDKPLCQRESPTLFSTVLQYIDMFETNNKTTYYGWSQCALHHSIFKFCKIGLWYECTRIIWMDYLLQIILH